MHSRGLWRRADAEVAVRAIRAPTVASLAPLVATTVRVCTTHVRAARALTAGFTCVCGYNAMSAHRTGPSRTD